MLEIILKGGVFVYILFIFSIIGLAFFIERFLFIKNSKNKSKDFLPAIRELYKKEGVKAAYRYCSLHPSVISNIFKVGLRNSSKNPTEIRAIIDSVGDLEIRKLEKNLGILATLGSVSPLVGFLGTVTGMIKAFMEIERLGGNVNASVLAGGIWEALITTAVGLSIGVLMYIGYNFLVIWVEGYILEVEENSVELLDILHKVDE